MRVCSGTTGCGCGCGSGGGGAADTPLTRATCSVRSRVTHNVLPGPAVICRGPVPASRGSREYSPPGVNRPRSLVANCANQYAPSPPYATPNGSDNGVSVVCGEPGAWTRPTVCGTAVGLL